MLFNYKIKYLKNKIAKYNIKYFSDKISYEKWIQKITKYFEKIIIISCLEERKKFKQK